MNRASDQRRIVQVRIEGKVQGVAYRSWTAEAAQSFGLSGWVRNRRDGSVEALFSGPNEDVEAMLAACAVGPPGATVDEVVVIVEGGEDPSGFEVLPTV